MKYDWKPIEDMDMEDGTHTCYTAKDRYGWTVFLTQIPDGTWNVETCQHPGGDSIEILVNCKTLLSAKRWAARYR